MLLRVKNPKISESAVVKHLFITEKVIALYLFIMPPWTSPFFYYLLIIKNYISIYLCTEHTHY